MRIKQRLISNAKQQQQQNKREINNIIYTHIYMKNNAFQQKKT